MGHGWVTLHMRTLHIRMVMAGMWISCGTHMDKSWYAHGWVVLHIWMSHVTHMDSHAGMWISCGTRLDEAWYTHGLVVVHTWISHVLATLVSIQQRVAVCCRVLQCVAVCCSVLQCVAVCCSVLQCVAVCCRVLQCVAACCSVMQWVAACCSVLQCVVVCCSVMQCAAMCGNALQFLAPFAHFNTLQHTATHCNTPQHTATLSNTLAPTASHCNTTCMSIQPSKHLKNHVHTKQTMQNIHKTDFFEKKINVPHRARPHTCRIFQAVTSLLFRWRISSLFVKISWWLWNFSRTSRKCVTQRIFKVLDYFVEWSKQSPRNRGDDNDDILLHVEIA